MLTPNVCPNQRANNATSRISVRRDGRLLRANSTPPSCPINPIQFCAVPDGTSAGSMPLWMTTFTQTSGGMKVHPSRICSSLRTAFSIGRRFLASPDLKPMAKLGGVIRTLIQMWRKKFNLKTRCTDKLNLIASLTFTIPLNLTNH